MPLGQIQPDRYRELLNAKIARYRPAFQPYFQHQADIFESTPTHYRMRAEFRMWHEGDRVDFVMFQPEAPRVPLRIDRFPVADQSIDALLPRLHAHLNARHVLKHRLFQAEFLATADGDTLLTLIYHRPLDEPWREAAIALESELGIHVIGRSRKQKLVVSRDYLTDTLTIDSRRFQFRISEGVFTQPNRGVNQQMINWVLRQTEPDDNDLLELYCGIGNFTLPLAQRFRRVLATEVSKQAVRLARHNSAANRIDNLTLVRMSSEEFSQAYQRARPFRRLADTPLEQFRLKTLLVDPPRAGLDSGTLKLAAQFDRIIYISCNPTTLLDNLSQLQASHRVDKLAFFDQFPYTDHLECGVILQRN